MKKETKKFLALGVLGILVFMLVMGFVAAQPASQPATIAAKIFDPVVTLFADWGEGKTSVNVAKFLFLALLSILIYSIAKVIPFIQGIHRFLIAVFSIIISFLATAYVTPQEIYMMLVSYGAMGLALGSIIPFVILVFFTIEVSKANETGGKIIAKILWVAFAVFLVYKLIVGMYITKVIGWTETIVYLVIIALSICFILWSKHLMRILFREELGEAFESEKRDIKSSLEGEIERRERDKPRGLSGGALAAYDRKTEQLRKRMLKLS